MKAGIKKAVCIAGKTAKNNKQHNRSYPQTIPVSSFIQIGEFLLLLLAGHGQTDGWQQFERLLSQFYGRGVL